MNRKPKYVLKLTADERAWLEGMVRTGKSAAWKIQHAHALLKMDQGEDGPMAALPRRLGRRCAAWSIGASAPSKTGRLPCSSATIHRARAAASSTAPARRAW